MKKEKTKEQMMRELRDLRQRLKALEASEGQRARTEDALRQKTAFVRLLQAVAVAANEASTSEKVLQYALDQVCAHTGWPVGDVYLLADHGQAELVPAGIWHLKNPEQFETFRKVTEMTNFAPGVGLPGRVLASGMPAWIIDVTKDPNFPRAKLAKDIGVKAGFAFPVLVGTEVVAVLEFFSAEAVEPDEPLLDVMAQVGTQLGRVIERTRAEAALQQAKEELEIRVQQRTTELKVANEDLRKEIAEHARAEVALREAEEKYRSIFEYAVEGIFQTTPDGRYRSANPALARIYGYGSAEELMETLTDIGPQLYVDHTRRAEFVRLMHEHGTVSGFESEVYRKDGNVIWISESARAVRDKNGALLYYEGTVEDITDRKRAESKLNEARERLQYLFAVSPAIIYTNQASGDFACTFVSENLQSIMGYTPREMLHDPNFWASHLHPEDARRVLPEVHRLIGKGGGTVEYRFHHRQGHYIWIHDTLKVISDEAGRPVEIIGCWADITELKRTEQALGDRINQVEALRAVTGEITRELDLSILLELITQRAVDLVEAATSGVIYLWDEADDVLIPRAWHGRGEWQTQVRVQMGEGLTGTVAQRREGLLVNDYQASPYSRGHFVERLGFTAVVAEPLLYRDRLVGVINLTNEGTKQPFNVQDAELLALFAAEAAIAIENARLFEEVRETRRYLERLIESSTDAIMSTDKEGNVVLFNEGAEAILGYRRKEIIGQRVSLVYESVDRAKELMRLMRKQGGTVSAFETVLRAKDGSPIPVMISASILYDEQGQETGTVGFNKDLRPLKQAEEELRRAKAQIQALRIEIDQAKKAHQVSEITDTEYFQDLQKKAKSLRDRPKTG